MSKSASLKQLDRLDQHLSELFALLDPLDHTALNYKPADGGWSAIQVLHHLILAEQGSLRYLQKKQAEQRQQKKAGLGAVWRTFLLRVSLKLPIKFKAPKMVGDDVLPDTADYGETKRQWQEERAALRAFLESLPEAHFRQEVYRHPRAGRMSIMHMLQFFDTHVQRHRGQVERVLREAGQ